jgi:hypothetical protein
MKHRTCPWVSDSGWIPRVVQQLLQIVCVIRLGALAVSDVNLVYQWRLNDHELLSLVVGGRAGKSAVAELVDQPQAFQRTR